MHHVKISPFWHICISFDGIAGYRDSDLEVRINCNIRHLRRMVASLIMKLFSRMSHYYFCVDANKPILFFDLS